MERVPDSENKYDTFQEFQILKTNMAYFVSSILPKNEQQLKKKMTVLFCTKNEVTVKI